MSIKQLKIKFQSQSRLMKSQHDLQSTQNDVLNLEKDLQTAKDNQEEFKEKIKVRKKQKL